MATKKKTFEENLAELEAMVAQLENGDIALEDAMATFKKGADLSVKLEKTLTEAESTLAKIMNENDEEVPFEEGE
jgi:exodeoxyribonuclease VII small subunit